MTQNNLTSQPQEPSTGSYTWTARYAEPWERVDQFAVNRWMVKLGAKWEPDAEHIKNGATGIGNQWELHGMAFSQTDATKWYYAVHRRKKWWQVWRQV